MISKLDFIKTKMENNIKAFLNSFADNTTDNTKLYYLNEKICEYLNAENCVFYHVGKHSSNGGMWKVPTHLEFLSE